LMKVVLHQNLYTMKKIAYAIILAMLSINISAQYNYFNFTSAPISSSPFTSTGNGMLLSPSNELYFRSSYGYMGLASGTGNNWSQNIIWGTQAPKTTSEFAFGDNKLFYVDENSKLRELFWNGSWSNGELNTSKPLAQGEGLAFAGNSTLYYITTTGSICRLYNVGSPTYAWQYENITTGTSGNVVAKANSRLVYGDNKLIYIDPVGRVRQLVYQWGSWQNGELNNISPAANGNGIAFGINSNIYYTTTTGKICNMFYNGGWNFNTISSAVGPNSGSKILCDQNTVYYVGLDNYFYSLVFDNCDWFNKKINKTVVPKPEAICWGNNQVFFRNNSDNVIYNAKTQTSSTQPYVYLKGKTFYNGSTPFYPLVMNYQVNLNTFVSLNTNPYATVNDLWISPSKDTYGSYPPIWMNQSSADTYFHADFQRLQNLGFNTIRIGPAITAEHPTTDPTTIPYFRVHTYSSYNGWCKKYNDPSFEVSVFNAISHVCDIASQYGIKVILMTTDGYAIRSDGIFPNDFQSNYLNYLSDLSDYFKDNGKIMAYDLYNEPGNSWSLSYGKENNCAESKQWYDKIRYNDNNHLITIGTFGGGDLMNWDPNILSVDFHSFHLYNFGVINKTANNNILSKYEDGVLAQMNWIKNNIKIPWIIGENSFSAFDINNPLYSNCGRTQTGWGTETEQKQYTIWSQTATRSAGGSGYSWWAYHDVSGNYIDPSGIEDYEGIYALCGRQNFTDRQKPAALEFDKNWLSYSCNNLAASSHEAYYGYDPTNEYLYTITGSVIDQTTSTGITDALIIGYETGYAKAYSTFSKTGGSFTLCSNNPCMRVDVSSSGKNLFTNWNPYNSQPPSPVISIGNIYLNNLTCSISSNVRTATTSLNEQEERPNTIEIYPNPSKDYLMIKHNFTGNFTIEMLDMLGRELFSQEYTDENTEIKINYNERISANNIVILKISNGKNVITKKVIVMK
jgi:hypothetical protein